MRKKIFLLLIVTPLLYVACNKEIKLKLPPYNSLLVINGEFSTDTTMSVKVSRSLPIMQVVDSSGYLIKNALVKFYENGNFIGDATYFDGAYVINHKPLAGSSYRVDASSSNYPVAMANLKMPTAFSLTKNYKDSIGLDADGFKYGQLSITFNDDPNIENYYKLFIRWYNAGALTWYPLELVSNDIIFINNDKLNDGSYLFSDRTFSGKTKSLAFDIPFGIALGSPKFEISIKTFNNDYYNYLFQIDDYSQSGNSTSNEPVIIRTNVSNGLGMVGGVFNSKDTIY